MPTRLLQERSAGKIMMIIFWDEDGVLPDGITINNPSDASIIERLHSIIAEKERGTVSRGVLLLLHGSAPIHKCNIVQASIRQTGSVEFNHCAYSSDIARTD